MVKLSLNGIDLLDAITVFVKHTAKYGIVDRIIYIRRFVNLSISIMVGKEGTTY